MSLRFWRPSLQGRSAMHHLVTGAVVVALMIGVLTSSVVLLRPAGATRAQQAPQHGLVGLPSSNTVQTLAHQGLSPRSDTFVRGPDGALWHRWWENVWHDWENLGVQIDSAPAAVADTSYTGGGFIHVFYRHGDDLMHMVLNVCCLQTVITMQQNLGHDPGYSHPWPGGGFETPGPLTSAPAVTSWGGGRIDVFAFADNGPRDGTDVFLLHRWFEPVLTSNSDDDGWSDWEVLSEADFAGDPAAVSWGPGRLDVLVHGSDDDHLYDKVYDAQHGGWHNWQDLGGTLLYSPAAASWGIGRIDVFTIGTDHQMWTKWYSNGQWSGGAGWDGYASLGGYFISSPGASSLGPGALDVVGVQHDHQLYHSWWGGQWSPWDGIGLTGYFSSAPAVADSWQSS